MLDLLSMNIDGNDYHILEAIELLNARVLAVEYNPKFWPPVKWGLWSTIEAILNNASDYLGASLKSFEMLLRNKRV